LIEEAERQGRRSGGMVVLAEMLGKSSSQVSRFAAEKSVTPSDRIAREIEQEHGWMDHVQLGFRRGGVFRAVGSGNSASASFESGCNPLTSPPCVAMGARNAKTSIREAVEPCARRFPPLRAGLFGLRATLRILRARPRTSDRKAHEPCGQARKPCAQGWITSRASVFALHG